MSIKTRVDKLEQKNSEQVLIVIADGELEEDAMRRWCESTRKTWPDNVLFVNTGVVDVDGD
ncbi:MAG: hypothetical protein WCP01_17055 [Methylococcaceae bacterium]